MRHRRISLLHLRGVPWARIAELVGQRDLTVTANTHTHVLVDEPELDYAALLNGESVFGALIALETCETIVLPTGGRRE